VAAQVRDQFVSDHVEFLVDSVALGQVFSEYIGFPCQFSFHRLLHIHHHQFMTIRNSLLLLFIALYAHFFNINLRNYSCNCICILLIMCGLSFVVVFINSRPWNHLTGLSSYKGEFTGPRSHKC
jgi:hypothetical protein